MNDDNRGQVINFSHSENLPDGRCAVWIESKSLVDYVLLPKTLCFREITYRKSGWNSETKLAVYVDRPAELADLPGQEKYL